MKLAATHAIAALAVAEGSEEVATAYGIRDRFGPDYLIPQPFDRRLITHVAPAVPEAAMLSGVATRPLTDLKCYLDRLARFVYHSGKVMQPVFGAAAQRLCRIVYAEGEDERVLRAAQVAVDERLVHPVLIGRPAAVAERLREFGLPLEPGREVEIIAPDRRPPTRLAAELVADGMLCGLTGDYAAHLWPIAKAIGRRDGVNRFAAMNLLMLPRQTVFICDTTSITTPPPPRSRWRTWRSWRRPRSAALAWCRGWRFSRIRASATPTPARRAKCARPAR